MNLTQQQRDAIARVEAANMTPAGKADCIARIKDGSFFKARPQRWEWKASAPRSDA